MKLIFSLLAASVAAGGLVGIAAATVVLVVVAGVIS